MSKFQVWSTHVEYRARPPRGEKPRPKHDEPAPPTLDVLETTRTDPKVAAEDRGIIADILHRKSWVTEVK